MSFQDASVQTILVGLTTMMAVQGCYHQGSHIPTALIPLSSPLDEVIYDLHNYKGYEGVYVGRSDIVPLRRADFTCSADIHLAGASHGITKEGYVGMFAWCKVSIL